MADQKNEYARQFVHVMLELRDELRRFLQNKFRENDIDLTYEMHQVMSVLWKKDGLKQQELAYFTLKDKASLTFLIDNLTKRELVTRKEDPSDRRNKLIYLTRKGKLLGKKVEPWLGELFTIAGKGFDAGLFKTYIAAVEKMRDNVKAG